MASTLDATTKGNWVKIAPDGRSATGVDSLGAPSKARTLPAKTKAGKHYAEFQWTKTAGNYPLQVFFGFITQEGVTTGADFSIPGLQNGHGSVARAFWEGQPWSGGDAFALQLSQADSRYSTTALATSSRTMMAIDFDNQLVWHGQDGNWYKRLSDNVAGDPATGAGGLSIASQIASGTDFHLVVGLYHAHTVELKTQAADFLYAPAGFTGWDDAGGVEPPQVTRHAPRFGYWL